MHKRIFVLGFVLGVLGARAGLAATVVLSNTNIVGTVNAGVTAQYTIDNRLSSNYYITNSVIIAANGQELFVSPFFSDDVNASGSTGMYSGDEPHVLEIFSSSICGGDGGSIQYSGARDLRFRVDGGIGLMTQRADIALNDAMITGGNGGQIDVIRTSNYSSADGAVGLKLIDGTLSATNSTILGGNGGWIHSEEITRAAGGREAIMVSSGEHVIFDLPGCVVRGGAGGTVPQSYTNESGFVRLSARGGSALVSVEGSTVTISNGTFIAGHGGVVPSVERNDGFSVDLQGGTLNLAGGTLIGDLRCTDTLVISGGNLQGELIGNAWLTATICDGGQLGVYSNDVVTSSFHAETGSRLRTECNDTNGVIVGENLVFEEGLLWEVDVVDTNYYGTILLACASQSLTADLSPLSFSGGIHGGDVSDFFVESNCLYAVVETGQPVYSLAVSNGVGSGLYVDGAEFEIAADAPPQGFVFGQWMGDTEYLADPMSSTTTITMPSNSVSVTALYYEKKVWINLPVSVTEGVGLQEGSITIMAPHTNLTVYLTCDDPSEIEIPESVVIPSGQTNVVFDVTVLDDALLNGSRMVQITAAAEGLETGATEVSVYDDETTVLSLTLLSMVEEGGTLTGTLMLSAVPDEDVLVQLLSDNTAKVPSSSVVVPAGTNLVSLSIAVVDDHLIDGIQSATLTATVENWTSGHASTFITDNDLPTLSMVLPPTLSEGDGVWTNAGLVSMSGTVVNDVYVTLSVSDDTELAVPPYVVIPAGQTNALFNLAAIDDTERDGSTSISITAQLPGYIPAQDSLTVLDNDIYQIGVFGPTSNVVPLDPVLFNIVAETVDGRILTSFTEPLVLSAMGDRGAIPVEILHSTNDVESGIWETVAFGGIGSEATFIVEGMGVSGTSTVFNVMGSQMVVTPANLTDTLVEGGSVGTRTITISNTGNDDLSFRFEGFDVPNLILHYTFDNDYGTTIVDESGNGNDGTVYNEHSYVDGVNGNGLRVVGKSDSYGISGGYVDLPTLDVAAISSNGITLSAWVKEEQTWGESYFTVGKVYFGHYGANMYFQVGDDPVSIPFDNSGTGQFVHYAISYSEGTFRGYRNGELVVEHADEIMLDEWRNDRTALGRHWINQAGDTATRFVGVFDDVRVYNRALSAEEITDIVAECNLSNQGDLDEGLAAYYPFNGSAIDETGNGNDGTVYGAVPTADRFGRPNSAYLLDGNDYILIEDRPAVAIGTNDFTCSVWIKTESSSRQMLLQRYKVGDGPYWFRINDDQGATTLTTYNLEYGHLWNSQSTVDVSDGSWHMITCIRQSDTTKIYVDGTLQSTASGTIRSIVNEAGLLYVGAQNYNDSLINYFKGAMDDIRIYDHALSEVDVQMLYTEAPPQINLDAGLVASYPFNGSAADESGNDYDGTVTGATLTEDRFGNLDSAYDFNGSSDFINCGNIINGFSSFTVSAWINIDRFTDGWWMGPWSQQNFTYPAGGRCNYSMWTGNNTSGPGCFGIIMGWADGAAVNTRSTHVVPKNEWHLISQTYDGHEIREYDNGVLINTTVSENHMITNSADFVMGKTCAYPGYLSTHFFDGQIDDLRIYDRSLSAEEISALVNESNPAEMVDLSDGLVASYPFSGSAADESGNGHNGTVSGATLTEDRFGNLDAAYAFDGNGDFINIGNGLGVEETDFTVSTWICSTNIVDGYEVFVSKKRTGDWQAGEWQLYAGMGGLGFLNNDGSSHEMPDLTVEVPYTLHDGAWHHVVGTASASGAKLYIDGVCMGTNLVAGIGHQQSSSILIGARDDFTARRYMSGKMDDVRIYNRALSEAEVAALWNENNPAEVVDLNDGLVASYTFSGDADDESGNGHDGTVNGAMLTEDRFGNAAGAYHFDGANDYIEMENSLGTSKTAFTASAWVRSTASVYQVFLSKKPSGDWMAGQWQMHLGPGGSAVFSYDDGGSTLYKVVSVAPGLNDGEWHHLCSVMKEGTASLYVDGKFSSSLNNVNLAAQFDAPMHIGDRAYSAGRQFFNGDIDDVRIYNRALSEAEVAALFSRGETKLISPDIISGTIPPGGSVDITISFDASGLPLGANLTSSLVIISNDPLLPTSTVDVSMDVVTAEQLVDIDLDGLPNAWERTYFGDMESGDPLADDDGDGLNNLAEYMAGTDPLDAMSCFLIALETTPDTNGYFIVNWSAQTGRVYRVEWASELDGAFEPLATELCYPCNSYTDTVHHVESSGFYQVGVEVE